MALRDSGKEHTGGQRRSTQKRTALNNRSLPCGIEFTSLISYHPSLCGSVYICRCTGHPQWFKLYESRVL